MDPEQDSVRHADLTARQLILTRAYGIAASGFYTWDGHDHRMVNARRPLPAAIAYRTVAQRLTNARPVAIIREDADGVFAYLFERRGVTILAAWTTNDQGSGIFPGIPVSGDPVLYDLMGNSQSVDVRDGYTTLNLGTGPQVLEGVDASIAGHGEPLPSPDPVVPPRRHPAVWFSYHYPAGSEVLGICRGSAREAVLRVHNDGDAPVTGKLEWTGGDTTLRVTPQKFDLSMEPRTVAELTASIFAGEESLDGLHRLSVRGESGGLNFGRMSIRCHVAEYEAVLFHMATWEMARHLVEAEGYGQGIQVRWINPQGYLIFRFDLTDIARAKLASYVDSVSPALTDGGNFRLSASPDRERWDVLLDGRGSWDWREINLTPYAGGEVYVRFDNPTDKGEARIRAMRLMTWPGSGTQRSGS